MESKVKQRKATNQQKKKGQICPTIIEIIRVFDFFFLFQIFTFFLHFFWSINYSEMKTVGQILVSILFFFIFFFFPGSGQMISYLVHCRYFFFVLGCFSLNSSIQWSFSSLYFIPIFFVVVVVSDFFFVIEAPLLFFLFFFL